VFARVNARLLAVLPARGGSKRIPHKNIKDFQGRPLLARTIETVRKSGIFDTIVVSTDDLDTAKLAVEAGAVVPFMRPADLSDDITPTQPVLSHAVSQCESIFGEFTMVCCVYPGAVLMTESDFINSSSRIHETERANGVCAAVVRYSHPIQRALRAKEDGLLLPADATDVLSRTQDLEPMWHDAGQFYWATPSRWHESTPLLSRVIPYEVPHWRIQDLDSEDDWIRAEMIFELIRQVSKS